MDLSYNVQNIRKSLTALIKEASEPRLPLHTPTSSATNMLDEIIDVNNISYADDENWLYESPVANSKINNLKQWLYQDFATLKNFDFHTNRLSLVRELARNDAKKNIDTRTFTRPKKPFSRPSIEGYLKSESSDSDKKECVSDNVPIAQQPLKFDFSQPTTSSIFEKIVATADDDSFQNMSPPSLINSMCSSTFTNLMENSMIKNDPLLREISDTEYTEAMLQDYDPPLFKSITDSYSSINLDNPESFIKQNADSTLNNVYKKNVSMRSDCSLNETYVAEKTETTLQDTYVKESSSDLSSADVYFNNDTVILGSSDKTQTFNGTYTKNLSSKLNETFQKEPLYRSDENLTRNITYRNDTNKRNSPKRHSYIVESNNELNQTISLKQNSFGQSTGSTDSLDYLSSLSSGSRDSNKMLNMAEVDAIVLQQEQSLQQAMSTPITNNSNNKRFSRFWENAISPVCPLDKGEISDSNSRSSNEEYRTVRSNPSSNGDGPSESFSSDPISAEKSDITRVQPKSLNMLGNRTLSKNRMPDIRGSYSNLKTIGTTLKGSYTTLKPVSANFKSSNASSTTDVRESNLKTMNPKLKGSYTQLKPVLLNLPRTDNSMKLNNPNTTLVRNPNLTMYKSQSTLRVAEVPPTMREVSMKDQVKAVSSNNVAKQQTKASGLPRPISSIPRPASSKIPAPKRTANLRHFSAASSKHSLDNDF